MHRDPTLRKRNAFAVPGVLLVLLSLVGILYAQYVRADNVECEDGSLVVLAGACRSAALLLAIPLVLGLVLIVLGTRYRSKATCHLGHGTTAVAGLAVLITLAALPLLAAIGLYLTQDPEDPYVFVYNEIEFGQARILALAGAAALLVLVPYLALFLATARPPKCCRDRGCFEPCFCDEGTPAPDVVPPPSFEPLPTAPGENAQVTTAAWTTPPAETPQPPAADATAAAGGEPWTAPLPPPVVPAPPGAPTPLEQVPTPTPASDLPPASDEGEADDDADHDEAAPAGGAPARKPAAKAKGKRKVTRTKKKA